MAAHRKRFTRPLGERRYRRLFIIATEGAVTEPQYFQLFNSLCPDVHVEWAPDRSHDSAPQQVLQRMRAYLKANTLQKSDEAWLVVDRDKWPDAQLLPLHQWSQEHAQYGLAVSNPRFEYWLLLHFEDGARVASASDCANRWKVRCPDGGKCIDARRFSEERIRQAVCRARKRDTPPCADWPRAIGTTVYRLVERLLRE